MKKLVAEIAELRARLAEAEDTLAAIRSGAVDALVVEGKDGIKIFTLKGADQTYRILVETMNEGAVTISSDGIILFSNQHFSNLIRLPIHKILGSPFQKFLPVEEQKKFAQFLKQMRKSSRRQETRLQPAKGEPIFVHLSGSRLETEEISGFCLVVTDVSRQKEAEAAFREISGRILQAQEQERRRVSRELHDGVNQILSATKFGVHSIERQLKPDDVILREKNEHVKGLIEKAIAEVRLISRNLHPSELDDIGLQAAIRTLIGEFCVRTGVQVIFSEPPRWKKLSPDVRLTIYRILQEALANIEKHAEAIQVTVILNRNKNDLVMMIRDNGKGFSLKAKQRNAGLGLNNMRERAAFVNGTMDVKSVVGRGTELMLQIPIPV